MIWMGVGGPKDFVASLNRFPPHYQWAVDENLIETTTSDTFC